MNEYRRFRPTGRGVRKSGVVVCPIEFGSQHRHMRPLIVSIPRTCGNSVKRNRLKRILKHSLKTYLGSLPEGKGLWIRLLRQHKIQNPVTPQYWNRVLEQANLSN
ncbi:ribonuclease P protein component [bacterium]|nr:ribonuclease P protein component [bacterium]